MPISESQLQSAIIEAAQLLGWKIHHCRPINTQDRWHTPIQGSPGFPDLVLARPPRLIFAELKSTKGRTTPTQAEWLQSLEQTPAETYLWRPEDWQSGTILEILSRDTNNHVCIEEISDSTDATRRCRICGAQWTYTLETVT